MRLRFPRITSHSRARARAWRGCTTELMTVTQIAIESGRSVDEVAKVLDIANLASLKMPAYQTLDGAAVSDITAAMERLARRRRGET